MKIADKELTINDWIFRQGFGILASAHLPRCGWTVGEQALLNLTVLNFSSDITQSLTACLERVSQQYSNISPGSSWRVHFRESGKIYTVRLLACLLACLLDQMMFNAKRLQGALNITGAALSIIRSYLPDRD